MDPVVAFYDQCADRYDRRWRRYTAATIDAAMSALDLAGDERILDAPCGTGALEERLKREHPSVQVAGIDASPAMLHRAAAKHAGAGYAWLEADVHALPFADASFDRIVCANSFHCFARPTAALAEFSRVLAAGGKLVLVDWCDDFLICKLCSLWLRRFDPAYRRMYTSVECRALLSAAGFSIRNSRRFRVGLVWGLMLFECVRPSARS